MGVPFNAAFTVPTSPEEVLLAFADVPRMAGLMPGAAIDGQDPDGSWRGAMLVIFGPKKIRFSGKVTLEVDHVEKSGLLIGRGAADARAARVESRIHFQVTRIPDGSQVDIAADTTMTGVLADFARTGGPVAARALLEQFSERLRAEFATPAAQTGAQPEAQHEARSEARSEVQHETAAETTAQQVPAAHTPPVADPKPAATHAEANALRAGTLLRIILRQWWQRLTGRSTQR